eukprot:400884-Pyramimonas_sp.AAC.1
MRCSCTRAVGASASVRADEGASGWLPDLLTLRAPRRARQLAEDTKEFYFSAPENPNSMNHHASEQSNDLRWHR